jgi:hypothetical protein
MTAFHRPSTDPPPTHFLGWKLKGQKWHKLNENIASTDPSTDLPPGVCSTPHTPYSPSGAESPLLGEGFAPRATRVSRIKNKRRQHGQGPGRDGRPAKFRRYSDESKQ